MMTFIVAEIGVNWDGNFEILEKMMKVSKNVGCNAVKFQAFNEEIVKDHPESQRLMKSSITRENIEKVNHLAEKIGIEWFATPMYDEVVDFLKPYVKRFKVREFDGRKIIKNEKSSLFEKLMESGKELIVSSQKSPKNSKYYGDPKIKWLYCVPKYPCELSEVDFSKLKEFDGYSNHVPKIIAPLTSAILGAEIIEIHITPDKNQDYIDNNVSFDLSELEILVNLIKQSNKIKR